MAQILSSKELAKTVCILLNNPGIIDEDPTSGVYRRRQILVVIAMPLHAVSRRPLNSFSGHP